MNLPIRVVDAVLPERMISVDGAWGQPGLNLSHWPGNTTPAELRHELSTGIALNFARLPIARRREMAEGCVAIANNHVDTDGVCALFAVAQPGAALERADRLLEAAYAGDFFRVPNERAFQVDATVAAHFDVERSPLRSAFAGLGDRERREFVTRELVANFARILDGDGTEHADLWRPELEALRADLADLARAQCDDLVHLDVAVFTAPDGLRASRASRVFCFDPGRHALFGTTRADRVLVIGPQGAGATYRFIVNTTSWFDLPGEPRLARPDLARLAAQLNELENTHETQEIAWRAQITASPAPELWFGRAESTMFAEHAPPLATSRLAPKTVKNAVFDALRAAWTFPEE